MVLFIPAKFLTYHTAPVSNEIVGQISCSSLTLSFQKTNKNLMARRDKTSSPTRLPADASDYKLRIQRHQDSLIKHQNGLSSSNDSYC